MVLSQEIEKAYLLQKQKLPGTGALVSREKFATIDVASPYVQIISGIRRCGKSSLLRMLMRKYKQVAYLNFEDSRLFNFELSDFSKLEQIFPSGTEAYFFDEIQNVPHWEIYIRQLHDAGKKIFITGSNASFLSRDLGTKLTGRYINTELFPFAFSEYLKFTKIKASSDAAGQYIRQGGFPDFLRDHNEEFLQNLLKDILFRDIAVRYGIRNSRILMDLALFLISNVGKPVSSNGLKNSFQVGSTNSVVDYLSWMEDAYLFFFLQKFSWSARSMAVNPRKVYAIDNGLIQANSLSFQEDLGRRLENAVFLHLRNHGRKMYYFREKRECDFVLFEKQKCTAAIQVCQDVTADNMSRELEGLFEAMDFFSLPSGLVVTYNQKETIHTKGKIIQVLPIKEFLLKY